MRVDETVAREFEAEVARRTQKKLERWAALPDDSKQEVIALANMTGSGLDFEDEARSELVFELQDEANRRAEFCGKCFRRFTPGETIYIDVAKILGLGYKGYPWKWRVPMGECCAPESLVAAGKLSAEAGGEWRGIRDEKSAVATKCVTCGRPLVVEVAFGRWRRNRKYFCSNRCRWTRDNRLRSERRAKTHVKICPVCGQEFVATRADAKTCSPTCRQRMYRQRRSR